MSNDKQARRSEPSAQKIRLLRTKLYAPRAHPDSISRDRLIERLDEGQRCALTLLSAPAGSGKTTLLGDWIQRRSNRVAWLSLDAGDNDPVRFWCYVMEALGSVSAGLGETMLALLQMPQPPPFEVLLADLINEIADAPEPMVLVLDDYHAIESAAIHKAVIFLLENLPPQLRLIIASRHDPPLPLARLRTRRQLVELRADDLRFTPDEAATFLNQVMGFGLAAEDVRKLEAQTEGWAAGLQLAALSMQSETDVAAFIRAFSGSHRYVFDYLAQEVLRRQPAAVRSFLLQTAILERLSGPLCDALTGLQDGRATLERLERANLFIVPLDQERQWYRYHHLFTDFLRAQLAREIGSEGVATLHRKASKWYAQHVFTEDAVGHALAGGDHEAAAKLIEDGAGEIFLRSELNTLVRWSRALPGDTIAHKPRLGLAVGWALLALGLAEEAEHRIAEIEREVGATADALSPDRAQTLTPDTRATLVEVAAMRSALAIGSFAMGSFDIPRALELARLVLPYLVAADDMPPSLFHRAADMRPVITFNMAIAHELSGEVQAAVAAFSEAATLAQQQQNLHILPMALSHKAQLQVTQGQLRAAAETFREALRLAKVVTGQPSPLAGMAHVGLGNLMYEWNELDEALGHLEEGIALGRKWRNWECLVPGYIGQARIKKAQGDWEGASKTLEELKELCPEAMAPLVLPAVDVAKAMLAQAQGDLDPAARWAESLGPSMGSKPPSIEEGESLTLARVLVARGRYAEAEALLEQLLSAATSGQRTGRIIEIWAIQAKSYHTQGMTDQALAVLQRALVLAEPEGFVRLFVDEGEAMAEMLRLAAAQGFVPGYANRLLAAFDEEERKNRQRAVPRAARPSSTLLPDTPTSPENLRPLAEPLSDREIEVLRLIAKGLTNEAIADNLVVSLNTVKTHVKNIYGKLGSGNRAQAIARGRELGLL